MCGFDTMAHSGKHELRQMEKGWDLLDKRKHPAVKPVAFDAKTLKVGHMPPIEGWPCFRYLIEEPIVAERVPGGLSFYAVISGTELRVCEVDNFLNGSYVVACPKPRLGSCASIKIVLEWTNFEAYHNFKNGGGNIASNSGDFRQAGTSK